LQAIASSSLTCYAAERRTALQSLYQQLEQHIEDLDRKAEELAWQRPQAGVLVPMRECLLENMILRSSDRILNRRPACPRCGEFEASSWSARTEEMSGGQHRDDEANGPSRSGEVKRKEAGIARAINHEKCATPRVCSGKQKLRRNVLYGADFVRDVIDSHQEAASAAIAVLLEGLISFSGRGGASPYLDSQGSMFDVCA
jgi:hypothetical protein